MKGSIKAVPADLGPLRGALDIFVREACALVADDNRLFMIRQQPWVRVEGSVGASGGSIALDTVLRPQPVLTTPAESLVAALDSVASVIEQVRTLPALTDFLPPLNARTTDFDENNYLRKIFAVDFFRSYLGVAQQPTYLPTAFEEAFDALGTIIVTRSVEERVLIPLEGLNWACTVETVGLSDTTYLRRVTHEDRQVLVNVNRDPILGGSNARSSLWAQAAVDSAWRTPFHAVRLSPERYQSAFDAITALRLAASGMFSAPTGHAVSAYGGTFGTLRTSHSIPLRANTAAKPYELADSRIAEVREVFAALEKLSRENRQRIDLGIERFNRSFDVPRPEERVVDLMIALDSLLGEKGPGSTYKLSIRLALYIAEEYSARARLQDLVSEAYRTRSAIVHGGRISPRPLTELTTFLDELEEAARRVLRRAILDASSGTRSIADIPRFIDQDLILGASQDQG